MFHTFIVKIRIGITSLGFFFLFLTAILQCLTDFLMPGFIQLIEGENQGGGDRAVIPGIREILAFIIVMTAGVCTALGT
mgnify:CR=1 FL=1